MGDSIFIILVAFVLVLAAVDLFVGVSNDAVNFLNSAVGSKIAPLKVILCVASLGVLFGATFSSGMMEVARSGVFNPGMFSFYEIIIVFLAVMITDVLLLNIFNSLGLPTSTTVSIVFELLGAAFFAAIYKLHLEGNSYSQIFEYLKSDRAITIIFAILVSVAIAFFAGIIVQFFFRLIFTFRFENTYKYLGGIYCGFAISAILYFLVVKGAKGASFMKPEYLDFINANTNSILLISFIGISIIAQIFVFLKFNVFKLIILAGTFALAFSFAGNDLVNFIGVPLAALDSFVTWSQSDLNSHDLLMSSLNQTDKTPTIYLLIAGIIMVVTLFTSKKAHRVIQTSINLSSSTRGEHEQFGASAVGRVVTRFGLGISRTVYHLVPQFVLDFIARRYQKAIVIKGQEQLPFDYVRASINLVLASILISSATSLKLPLSTTYVTFMVAMGSSFADGAWDRESAVYRISGVITVIAGWFITAFTAFSAALIVCWAIFSLGLWSALVFMILALAVIVKSNFMSSNNSSHTSKSMIKAKGDNTKILEAISEAVPEYYDLNLSCIQKALDSFFEDNEYQLRKARNKASNVADDVARDRATYYTLALDTKQDKNSQKASLDAMHFYYLSLSNINEASKSIRYATDQAVIHVANRHTIFQGVLKDNLFELLNRLKKISADLKQIAIEPTNENVQVLIKHSRKINRDIDRSQVELVNLIGSHNISMHSSEIYLTFVQSLRDVANRYSSVALQLRSLSQIVANSHEQKAKVSKASIDEAVWKTQKAALNEMNKS